MRAAMTRRSVSEAAEAIDAIDSPTDDLDNGSLAIVPQTSGQVIGISNEFVFAILQCSAEVCFSTSTFILFFRYLEKSISCEQA